MPTHDPSGLPPGQRARPDFPRFGLLPFARRFPRETSRIVLKIAGDVRSPLEIEAEVATLPRVEQVSDFHCVTTWSRRGLRWSGVRFADLYEQLILPRAAPAANATLVVLHGQDGYRNTLLLEDLLAPDVLLADRLDGEALPVAHGAPLRLVVPACYGYKSIKHLHRLEFLADPAAYRPVGYRWMAFMAHPRARVAAEERGQYFPGWFLRSLYRPLVRPVVARFERALAEWEGRSSS